jgi:LuxR family maltose regulon positive regulatory protein
VPPEPGSATISRPNLLGILRDRSDPPVAALIAPPGYGKTTLLAYWAREDHRPVAWLTLDALDNDPALLVAHLAASMERVGMLRVAGLLDQVVAPERILASVMPRLTRALHEHERPGLVILDDIHVLAHPPALDIIAILLDHLPAGWRVGLAGRHEPPLPLARLRVQRRLLEIDMRLLALNPEETAGLAEAAGYRVSTEQARQLTKVTEGWAAGVYLALLASETRLPPDPVAAAGPGGPIAAYLRAEVGGGLGEDDARFLRQTSVLEVVTEAAAEAVTQMPDARDRLDRLAAGNLLIQAQGGPGGAFRYHHVLRDYLRADLEHTEYAQVAELNRRAASHFAASGAFEDAVEHAFAAADRGLAADLVTRSAVQVLNRGHGATLDRWFAMFTPEDFLRYGPLAVIGAWYHLLSGDGSRADLLADFAERATFEGRPPDGSESFESQRALLRAVMVRNGPRDALQNATLAAERERPGGWWYPNTRLHLGCTLLMVGDEAAAVTALEAAASSPVPSASSATALAILASLQVRHGNWRGADERACAAIRQLGEVNWEGLVPALGVFAVSARIATQLGDAERARADLLRAQLVRPLANQGAPWHSVFGLVELTRAHLAASDPSGARVSLREAEHIVRRRPMLGTLTEELVALRAILDAASYTLAGVSALTAAELRLMPLLATYLPFGEIADRLGVSRNTVKTHAMSIYGKLFASTRSEAVERAVEIGLLEPYPGLPDRRR